MRFLIRTTVGTLAMVVGMVLAAIVGIYLLFWSSLPSYDGHRTSEGINESLTIERDKLGVPTIRANSRETVSYGIGFCHGQDRFFQMDMLRRVASGELSALVGKGGIGMDTKVRLHNFREHSKLVWENLSDYEKTILKQYTKGVNEGLTSLKTRPPEYWLLKVKPQPWLPEDSILVIFTFYLDLQNNPDLDYARWVARKTLPKEVVQFLDGNSHSWEAAIDGSQILNREIPGPEAFSYLKATPKDSAFIEIPDAVERMPGSNNWVVGPEASVSGFPILAEDPHLNLGVPNTWYKMSYSFSPDGTDNVLDIHGFSVPGLPGIAFGTNGRMAWGITNGSLDTDDLIILEPSEHGFPEYKTSTGTAQIQQKQEIIAIKGAEPMTMEIEYTQWGPVVGETPTGEKRVRRWSAYHPDAANIRSMLIERSVTNEEFIETSYESNLPVQNYVLADDGGNIAWTLSGFLPDRNGRNPFDSINSSEADQAWTKKLERSEFPKITNPENHLLWTANNRVSGEEKYLSLGSGDFSEFPRAYQIREKLLAKEKHSPRTLAAIQHDNSVTFLIRWRKLLLDTLNAYEKSNSELARFKKEVEDWNGRADGNSIGYTIIRDFRNRLTVEVLRHITQPCYEFEPEEFDPFRFMTEEAIYQIVCEQPDYLLNPIYDSWLHQFSSVIDELCIRIKERGWDAFRWGNRNQSDYRHPITYAVPALNGILSMPQIPLEGDHYCPKVLSHSLAAGVRMIVSPGKLEDSIFQMGCGQSGHFMSKNYRDLQRLWATEEYLPLLPGEVVHSLTISPR